MASMCENFPSKSLARKQAQTERLGGISLVPGSKSLTTDAGFWSLPWKPPADPQLKIQRQPNSVINGCPPPGVWRWAGVISALGRR